MKTSRAGLFAGLQPLTWVVLFEKEDPTEDPIYNYRNVELYLQADNLNQANTEIIIQDSPDGITWANRQVVAAPLVPGGELTLSANHRGRWVRVCLYSAATGRVDATLNIPEEHVTPGLWPDVHTLSCASYCEVSNES